MLGDGSVLGGYRIDRELGRGGMAVVYLAHDLRHDRPVALKVLRPEVAQALGPARFAREIQIAAQVHHPNILPLYDSGAENGTLYYVMPYVAGGTLRDRLRREGPLPVAEAIAIAGVVAEALDAAHRQGVVHRDIKPENILIDAGRPLVADFGIARLIGATGATGISTSGLVLGTPGYMSPEQLSGAPTIDGRSDVYSLGCVLYEMLAGEPPFTGPTVQAVASRHLHERIPSLSLVRPGVPKQLEQVVQQALAKLPVDRFATAGAFRDALESGVARAARPATRRRRLVAAPLVLGGFLAALFVAREVRDWWRDRAIDPRRYAAVPFRHVGAEVPQGLDGAACATLVYDAMRRWPDLKRADRFTIDELVDRAGGPASLASLSSALAVARAARAGSLIWGEIEPRPPSALVVRAYLYDVRAPVAPVHEIQVTIPSARDDSLTIRFELLVDSLLARGQPAPPLGQGRPYDAVLAYVAANDQLAGWNLEAARDSFARALELEPAYADAALRFAQLSAWLGEPSGTWRDAAALAAGDPALSRHERLHGDALRLLADGRFADSCDRYRTIIAADSADFAAWFGLGECQFRDTLVLRHPTSPSGWRFRSSYAAAANAYGRALDILPSARRAARELMVDRLARVLITRPGQYRRGGGEGMAFAAYPSLSGDTVAFVPIESARLFAPGGPAADPAAIDHDRRALDALSLKWVSAYPESPAAWETRARALELAGLLAGPGRETALWSIRRARTLDEAGLAARLATAEVRILVKAGAWGAARALTDSLLGARSLLPEQALAIAPLAGLLGRPTAMAALLAQGAGAEQFYGPLGQPFQVPIAMAEPALRLFAYAVLGGQRDTVAALEATVQRLVDTWPRAGERGALALALLAAPAQFGFPELGPRPIHRAASGTTVYLLDLQARLAAGDTSAVRAGLDRIDAFRIQGHTLPQELALDAVHQEAWLRVAIGDTARAVAALDAALGTLPIQQAFLFQKIQGPAALVRAMILRARLAGRTGDRATARRWSAPALELWRDAEPSLLRSIEDLRDLTR